jgi:hypothetical protein
VLLAPSTIWAQREGEGELAVEGDFIAEKEIETAGSLTDHLADAKPSAAAPPFGFAGFLKKLKKQFDCS